MSKVVQNNDLNKIRLTHIFYENLDFNSYNSKQDFLFQKGLKYL